MDNIGGDGEPADDVVFVYDGVNEAPADVTHVRVLPTVTIIPEYAFWNHNYLLEVELPEGLTKIEDYAFNECISLKSINLPSTLQEIGQQAFDTCGKLEDVVLPTGLRILGEGAFYECRSLKSIHVPPNVRIGKGVFIFCGSLTDVTFAEGLESIAEDSFSYCTSLVSVKFPSSLKVIHAMAFEACNLTEINLPDTVETIRTRAFGRTNLQTFRIPPLVSDVNINMFERCNCLVSIELSSHVRNINDETDGHADINTIQLNKLRNIALPPECTLSADMDMYMLEICKDLRVAFPNDEDRGSISHALKHRFDNLPIHKICYYQSYHDTEAVLGDLKREINPWTSKFPGQLNLTGTQQDCLGMTPLHILACSTKQGVEIYRLLIGKYPEALVMKDKWGDIPLLYAFWCNVPEKMIELLVESYKTKHPDYEFDWRGMLQTLDKARVSLTNIQKLVSTQQISFPEQKIQGMEALVLDLAISDTENDKLFKSTTPIETFKYLLRTSITKRLDILNVRKWSAELQNSINALPEGAHNRENEIKAIYANLDMYELAKEASVVLELALWKMKIDERVVSNIDDQSSRKKAKVEDGMSARNLCRINCGADIIIPGVLHYLEPKPVEIESIEAPPPLW
jgi:hypothetical protein